MKNLATTAVLVRWWRTMHPWILAGGFLSAITLARGQPDLKIGMIGLDTSHVVLVTTLLNDAAAPGHIAGARVVCAYKGGSREMEKSWSRVDKFAAELRDKHGVALVDSIAEVVARSDAVMIMSVDGRMHLAEAREVFGKGKPVYIDKPLATTLSEAAAIVQLSRATHTPFFSASPFRYTEGLRRLREAPLGRMRGAVSYGNATAAAPLSELFYEGIHPVEALFTVMGGGVESVTSIRTKDTDVLTGLWPDGRTGVVYGLRNGDNSFGVTVYGEKAIRSETKYVDEGFAPLTREIIAFFQTGRPPLAPEAMLEIIAFIEAAEQSQRAGGAPVDVARLLSTVLPSTH